jgi:hypothetical protein
MKIEVRRMDNATWVKLRMGLAVVPMELLQELREQWTNAIAVAVKEGRAVVNVGLDGGPIPENDRGLFGGADRFSRAIAVYDREKDRTVKWQCPDCGHEWRAE